MPKCKICGARLKDGMNSCPMCGAVTGASPTPVASTSIKMTDVPRGTAPVPAVQSGYGVSPSPGAVRAVTADDFIELGNQLYENDPTPSQQREAFRYYQKALSLDADNARAHMLLGMCYFYGSGTGEDNDLAYRHFSEAHFGNECDGTAMLGLCYCQGTGVGQDIDKGLGYISDANRNGSQIARQILQEIDEMAREQEAQEEAEYRQMCREREWARQEEENRNAATAAAIGAGVFLGGALLEALFG